LLEALGILAQEGTEFEAAFYGTALSDDAEYRAEVVRRSGELALDDKVKFFEGVPHSQAPGIFSQYEISVNLASSGTYDKTMFEAAACGCLVLAASQDFEALAGKRFRLTDAEDAATVAEKLRETLALPENERTALAAQLREKVLAGQSLPFLAQRIQAEMSPKL
ncbi:glycosyltransferase family 1 protein, partial [Candidatus Kaiserbacteria bacterium]|nr:glycosyltransferase family 1 protein [Candidatus Kaiserbacteria bacterium]